MDQVRGLPGELVDEVAVNHRARLQGHAAIDEREAGILGEQFAERQRILLLPEGVERGPERTHRTQFTGGRRAEVLGEGPTRLSNGGRHQEQQWAADAQGSTGEPVHAGILVPGVSVAAGWRPAPNTTGIPTKNTCPIDWITHLVLRITASPVIMGITIVDITTQMNGP